MSDAVRYSVADGIAVVTIDSPPVNAINRAVRSGLEQAFTALHTHADVQAIVFACAGRTFAAGADIKEFDTGIGEPGYLAVYRLIDDSPCPVVAAVHGTALSGGTELTASTCG